MAIRSIQERNKCLTLEGNLIEDIIELAKFFAQIEWHFCKKETNEAIYNLVKFVDNDINYNDEQVWLLILYTSLYINWYFINDKSFSSKNKIKLFFVTF